MKKVSKWLAIMLIFGLVSLCPLDIARADSGSSKLVLQKLDYTENPVDISNPDRGFYRADDELVVPVSGSCDDTINVGEEPVTVGGAQVTTRITHITFDMRNFSSNAFTTDGTEYTETYNAPEYPAVSIKSRGDPEPWDYDRVLDYWKANVLTTWTHGRSQPLTVDALNYIRSILQQVREGNGVAQVRFSYDSPGWSWVSVENGYDGYVDECLEDIEPDKETMLEQIAQLKPILHEYEDVIMGIDGGFFGPWGEMHSTTFGTSPEAYTWLLNALLDAVPESRSIVVQGGAFLSWYNSTYNTNYTFTDIDKIPTPQPGTPEARFGYFNDSYAYGADEGEDLATDWGSLAEGIWWPGQPLGDEESYDRGKIMTWIRHQNNLYGGEAQGGETLWNTFPFVAWEASYAQTVYLNADYEDQVHDRWGSFIYNKENVAKKMTNAYKAPYNTEYAVFDPVYNGKTGAEYFRDRLGYRLVLREAKASEWVAQNDTLRFEGKIQNVGFGNIVNKKNVSVILKSKTDGRSYKVLTDLDAREWRPDLDSRATNTAAWRDLNFSVNMSEFGNVPAGDYYIYLKINDSKETSANKRCIRFANKGDGIWEEELGANLIGSTTVRDDSCVEQVNAAVTANLVRQDLQSKYSQAATRAEFCSLTVALYENSTGKTITDRKTFDDTSDINVEKAAAIGVVNGTGKNRFSPNEPITREEGAVMLSRLADAIGKPLAKQNTTFLDSADISSWAVDGVGQVQAARIMSGTDNKFLPKSTLTREQSIIAIMRLYDVLK